MSLFLNPLKPYAVVNHTGYVYDANRTKPSSNHAIFSTYFGDLDGQMSVKAEWNASQEEKDRINDFTMQRAIVRLMGADNWINNVDEIALGYVGGLPNDEQLLSLFMTELLGVNAYLQHIASKYNFRYPELPALADLHHRHSRYSIIGLLPNFDQNVFSMTLAKEALSGEFARGDKAKCKMAVSILKACITNIAQDYVDYVASGDWDTYLPTSSDATDENDGVMISISSIEDKFMFKGFALESNGITRATDDMIYYLKDGIARIIEQVYNVDINDYRGINSITKELEVSFLTFMLGDDNSLELPFTINIYNSDLDLKTMQAVINLNKTKVYA